MQKVIKKHGNYLLIRFDRGDKEIYGLKADDILKVKITGKIIIRIEKVIRKESGSIALVFNKTEQTKYGLNVGDLINIEILAHTHKNQKEVK